MRYLAPILHSLSCDFGSVDSSCLGIEDGTVVESRVEKVVDTTLGFSFFDFSSSFGFSVLGEGWKDPLNDEWLDDIQRDKHSLNSHEHFTEANWNIAHFCMKRGTDSHYKTRKQRSCFWLVSPAVSEHTAGRSGRDS